MRRPWLLRENNPAKRPEVREKIRLAKLGNTCGRGNKGKKKAPPSEATRHKLSLAQKGKQRSLETRTKISQALMGRKLSEGHKRSLSLGQHRRFSDPKEREKIGRNNLAYWGKLTNEKRAAIIKPLHESNRDWSSRPGGDARRRAISVSNARAWGLKTPEERHQIGCKAATTAMSRGSKHLPKTRPNRPEKKLWRLLATLFPNSYKYTGAGEVWIGNRNPDFMNVNGRKAVVELWGDYWHAGDDPERLTQHYHQYGFSCLIVWEHELATEHAPALVDKLTGFSEEYEPRGYPTAHRRSICKSLVTERGT